MSMETIHARISLIWRGANIVTNERKLLSIVRQSWEQLRHIVDEPAQLQTSKWNIWQNWSAVTYKLFYPDNFS